MFCVLFDHIEEMLPGVKRVAQVKELGRLVEGLLRSHAVAEEDLVLLALDHSPVHKRRANRLHAEHHEIDSRITRVYLTKDLDKARGLFKSALVASRKHFAHEERVVFPFIEQTVTSEMLARMGGVWLRRRHMPASWSA